jgi:hypothetical protein
MDALLWTSASTPAFLATATVLLASSSCIFVYYYWYSSNKQASQSISLSSSSTKLNEEVGGGSNTKQPSISATPARLKNVWDAPRNLTSRQKAAHPSDKPFGSKYYYAHNNPNATGGYKDGLQMEDFAMNGPRLLSKGGKPVVVHPTAEETTTSRATSAINSTEGSSTDGSSSVVAIRHITKYLWDDPGDSKGVATIRIDSLPSIPNATGTQLVDWQDVVTTMIDIKVEAKLAGEGLLVQIHSPQAKYQLKIPRLYGDVASVQAVVKPKRLLIKLTKKKKGVLSRSKSNMDAWPQPHRKL